jgi:hypothetical protein
MEKNSLLDTIHSTRFYIILGKKQLAAQVSPGLFV